jgi:hypothetical protein
VIDDGELGRIRTVFAEFDVDLEHLSGRVIGEDLEGPVDVVVATVKRILDFEGSLDFAELAGKPTWIAVHGQDFLPLRVRLRKLGVHFLVQSSVGTPALRLLLMHALHEGAEKRDAPRLPVGSVISYSDDKGGAFRGELLDLSREGCRLVSLHPLAPGASLLLDFPSKLAGGEDLSLPGRVLRSDSVEHSNQHLVIVAFDEIESGSFALLDAILEGKVIGTVVTRLGEGLSEETAALTIPSATAEQADELPEAPAAHADTGRGKRRNPRVEYTREVTMLLGGGEHVVQGSDLSIGGIRVEPLPELAVGTELEIAIYGASGAEPVLVQAVVARDDGPRGTVFRFKSMAAWDRPRIEAIIATTPEIQCLSGAEVDPPA